MKSLSYIEIDIPVCSNTYGVAPCTASIPTTGEIKCFNCKSTCQDRENYDEDEVTLRFAKPTAYLPKQIDCIPNVQEIAFTPATISLGENLGTRATLSVTFFDHKHSDTGEGFDKYLADRGYDPYEQGTFWGKFRARQPFLRGRSIRWITGLEGQDLAGMETRNFVLESFDGPSTDGKYTLVAKDVLKLVDGDRALAPSASTGFLVSAITSGAVSATLSPSGVGDAEYPLEGYLAIGGKEIVSFTRWANGFNGENDAYTKVMLHMAGSNGGTTFADVAAGGSAKTWTATNAVTSTANPKFGATSMLTAAGYITTPDHADFTLGSGDWTIDFWMNFNGATGNVAMFGQSDAPGLDDSKSVYMSKGSSGLLGCSIRDSGGTKSIVSVSNFNTLTGYNHIALVRSGSTAKLYVNGVLDASVSLVGAIWDGTGAWSIGRIGAQTSNPSSAYFAEFRLSVGVARWTANFTPPAAAYTLAPRVTTGDALTLTARGLFNTAAAAANAQDRVQLILKYTSADPADIIYDLMVNYGGVPASFITPSDWQTETATFLGRLYSAIICEPTSVATLVSELIQQAGLCIWWDDVAQKIRLQVLRGIVTDAVRFTPDNYISFTTKEQPDKRISQVLTYFGQINPLKNISDLDNYRSSSLVIDEEAEADYGGAVIKKILSRWIPPLGRTVADRLGAILLSRYRDPPRKLTFDLSRYAGTDVQLGGGYRVAAQCLQDETGALVDVPVQVTRLNPPADRFKVEAEEVLFAASNDDPNFHPIVIDANTTNVNLRTAHDAIYGAPTSDTVVECRILAGVSVTGSSTTIPVFDIGSWPSGVEITLIVEGDVLAPGGDGGTGYIPGGNLAGQPGSPGGTALYTRYPINLELPPGCRFWAGGGGGGGGGANDLGKFAGGGGGGAGSPPGHGGNGAFGAASPGTPTSGGLGGAGEPATYNGSPGGDPGLPGISGLSSTAPGGARGEAGAAIDGASFVTLTVGGGDSRGSLIN